MDTLEWIHSTGNKLQGFRGHWKCRCGFTDNCIGDSFCERCDKYIDDCIQEGYWNNFYQKRQASIRSKRNTQCILCDGYGCERCERNLSTFYAKGSC